MKNLSQLFLGIIIALVSIGLLLGGLSLSLAEGNSIATSTPTAIPSLTPTSTPTWQPITPSVSTTPLMDSPTPLPSWTPSLTLTPPPPPVNCPPRPGWLVYFVQPGETLDSIATRYQISSAELQNANCMLTKDLLPGVVIYVPPIRTQPPLPCGAPYGWVIYYIQPGDSLYRLSLTYGVTVARLQSANCLGSSTLLHAGQVFYIPNWPPIPASPTSPGLVIPTSTSANTLPATAVETITSMPTDTPIPAASDIPAEVATATPIPATP